MEREGTSLLRSPRFQRHGGHLDEAPLKVVSPAQSTRRMATATTVTMATAATAG